MADPDMADDDAMPECSYSSATFSLTDNIAFKKVERRRTKKRDLIHCIEAKKKALKCSNNETEYRSAGLGLLAAAGLKEKSSPLLPNMQIDSHLGVPSTDQEELMDIQSPSDPSSFTSETEDCDAADDTSTTLVGSSEVMPLFDFVV